MTHDQSAFVCERGRTCSSTCIAWKLSCICCPSSSSKTLMPTPSAAADGLELLARGATVLVDALYDDPLESVPTNITCCCRTHAAEHLRNATATTQTQQSCKCVDAPFQLGAVHDLHDHRVRRVLDLHHRDQDARGHAQSHRVVLCSRAAQRVSAASLTALHLLVLPSQDVASQLSGRTT